MFSPMSLSTLLVVLCIPFVAVSGANSVRVNKSCFASGEDIAISFVLDSPRVDDWVGFYGPSTSLSVLPSPSGIHWIATCGSRSCLPTSPIKSGTIVYRDTLEIGTWKAVIAHDDADGAPYTGLAQSSSFAVRASCSPAPAPVRTPTRSPVRTPTRAPTRASTTSALRTDKTTYTVGEQIAITFNYGSPQSQDWIGVYPASANNANLRQGLLWLWTCGTQTCGSSPSSGTVRFTSGTSWTGSEWPLPAGSFKAFVLRNDIRNSNGGFVAVATSATFTVKSTSTGTGVAGTVAAARADIEDIIVGRNGDQRLAGKFLRLAFHDSIGRFDGCVDLTDPENFGLLTPISALRPVVANHAGKNGFTRADVWALAAVVAADVMQSNDRITFNLDSVGRVNCEVANTVCRNAAGTQQACSDIRGPGRTHPGMHLGSRELFSFFANEYGFSIKESVAIMGAHTIGQLDRDNSGVESPNGWKLANDVFDNGYYHELIGGDSPNDSLDTHVNDAPGWTKGVERNSNGFPDRNIWVGFPGGQKIIMLNVDIALVRLLDSSNMDRDGNVDCTFRRNGACPVNNLSIQFAIDYTFDNQLWLTDFRTVLNKMLINGYRKTSSCVSGICTLTPN